MAGFELPETPAGRISEDYVSSTVCQERGFKAQSQTELVACEELSSPRDNNCQTRQCCKAKCDSDPFCTGFVFGNSAGNNCRSNGDGQNCCWLKGGTCTSAFDPLTAAYRKTEDEGGSTTGTSSLVLAVLPHSRRYVMCVWEFGRSGSAAVTNGAGTCSSADLAHYLNLLKRLSQQ
jgi:hypothetical protein